MGKAKKGKKKVKKEQPPLPLREPAIRYSLDKAKTKRMDLKQQDEFLLEMISIAQLSPASFQYANYKSEVPISILLALEKHPNDAMFRQKVCTALWHLIETACLDTIARYGAKVMREFMEKNLDAEQGQMRFIGVLMKLPSHHTNISDGGVYDHFGKAGFHKAIIKAMKAHSKNLDIFDHGGKALARLALFSKDETSKDILTDTIGELLASVDCSQADELLAARFCEVLGIIMASQEAAISVVMTFDGPRRVLAMMERHPGHDVLQGAGCHFLASFADDDDLLSDCFPAVMAAFVNCPDDVGAERPGLLFIVNMFSAPSGRSLLLESEQLPLFLDMMERINHLAGQLIGCYILESLTYKAEAKEPVTAEGAARLLADALNGPLNGLTNTHICHVAICAVGNVLVKGDKEIVMDVFLKKDCFANMVTVMERARKYHEYKDDLEVCTILREMASLKRNDMKLEIATSGGAGVIIDCMKRNPGNKAVQSLGCEALGLITINKDPEIFEAISKVDGVNIILDAVERFPKDKVIFNFGGSAALLTREYEDDKSMGSSKIERRYA